MRFIISIFILCSFLCPHTGSAVPGFSSVKNFFSPNSQCKSLNTIQNLFREAKRKKCKSKKSCSNSITEKGRCAQIRKLLCNPYCSANIVKKLNKSALARKQWLEKIEPLYKNYFGHASGFINTQVRNLECKGEGCEKGNYPKIRLFSTLNNDKKARIFVLSLDGGGIKGIIPSDILQTIEKKIKKRLQAAGYTQKAKNFQLSDVFTLSAGTSTGGLIALYLNAKNPQTNQHYKTSGLIPLYKELGRKVFHSGSKLRNLRGAGGVLTSRHSAKPLEALLREKLGNQTLAHTKNFVLTTSTVIEKRKLRPSFLFSTSDAIKSLQGNIKDKDGSPLNLNYFLWQAGRATSAAPTYFKPFVLPVGNDHSITLVDGGVGANNPIGIALFEAAKIIERTSSFNFNDVEIIILSLSTGENDSEDPAQDFSGPFGGGALQILAPTLESLMNVPNYISKATVRHGLQKYGGKVIRIEPKFKRKVPFNIATEKAIAQLEEKAQETINLEKKKIDEIVNDIFISLNLPKPNTSPYAAPPIPPRRSLK